MSKRVRSLLIVISLCLSLTITGCGLQALLGIKNKTSSTTKGGTEPVIAVSLNPDDPNKLLISKGIDDLAKKENAKVKYMDQSGASTSTESPLKGAKILIYQGGDASLLQKSQTDKIPILALTKLPTGVKPEGIVTPDQEKVGELMAQSLVSKVTEGQVVILQDDPNEGGSQKQVAGNRAVLSKYPKITVQTIANPLGSESVTKQGLVDFLQKNPGKVQGVLAQNEKLAAIANTVLKQAQLDKKIILVGGEASVPSLERMTSGDQVGDVDTSPYLQGVNAYQWAQKIIKKQPLDVNDSITSEQGEIPAKIIQVKAVTPDNLAVVQKSYTKTLQSAEQDKKQKDQQAQKTQQGSQSSQSKDQGTAKEKAGEKQGTSGGGDQAQGKSSSIPAGVQKVTERIKTETTREYLDAQGKVIGTEKTANEQVKTVPPEMLKQQTEQTSDTSKSQGQGDQSKDKGK
ncbi:sugar ABC transporter substrate-binding protein [Desulfosporosinus metallidurans]|uniref:Ribose ABC transport system, periplasmic ribose-binding protein RbsB n=1 Tax=Desulfosporosinus metallidurans TaxID=1888891 RepID=A0A1Q8R2W2_9FIRM|nr:substrate-binding domain-containing protein [Desulfosporosinus metallidurans]OLN33898.1 Ribose ABC transport system, periplasmic ribose-binding protein RbsB [Desulfosporosinus metallidurans]